MGIIQMSLTAAMLILAVIMIRQLAIHRLPKRAFVAFWCVVLVRLLIPFSVTLPAIGPEADAAISTTAWAYAGTVVEGAQGSQTSDVVNSGTGMIASDTAGMVAEEPTYSRAYTGITTNTVNAMLPRIPESIAVTFAITLTWAIGMLAAGLFFLITHLRSRRIYRESLPVNNAYVGAWIDKHRGIRRIQARQSDRITAPLTYGLIKPVILFPKSTNWQDIGSLQYILTHEMTHIRRLDVLLKWLLAAALCIHWFNPLVWAMYILANRDIELACDEAVVRACGETTKSGYAKALVGLEESRGMLSPLYASFSKNSIEERIVAIMKI